MSLFHFLFVNEEKVLPVFAVSIHILYNFQRFLLTLTIYIFYYIHLLFQVSKLFIARDILFFFLIANSSDKRFV